MIKTKNSIAKHEQLYKLLANQISRGNSKPHSRLPSELQLQEIYKVSGDTVRRTLNKLERSGLVYKIRYKGTFVAPKGKVGRILIVTNYNKNRLPNDYGFLYGFYAFDLGVKEVDQYSDLEYTFVTMNSDEFMKKTFELKHIHKDLKGVVFFRDSNPLFHSRKYLKQNRIPYIFYGSDDREAELKNDNHYFYRNRDVINAGLDYLLSKKCNNIFFATDQQFEIPREKYFKAWMKQKGLDYKDRIIRVDYNKLPDLSEFKGHNPVIFCLCDRVAITLLNEAVRNRIDVPGQLGILGIDNYPVCLSSIVQLSTVNIPLTKDAVNCLTMFIKLLRGEIKKISTSSSIDVIERDSTCEMHN